MGVTAARKLNLPARKACAEQRLQLMRTLHMLFCTALARRVCPLLPRAARALINMSNYTFHAMYSQMHMRGHYDVRVRTGLSRWILLCGPQLRMPRLVVGWIVELHWYSFLRRRWGLRHGQQQRGVRLRWRGLLRVSGFTWNDRR